ncbi:hypothetical protein [Runella sp. SP2]|uniref:hypothetical protein n=1 Tax=Runella sp. SP2 TaxID=2268026 RepID=UPI000F08AF65|nr:hypothetical protein [Runella sp. SP2]AYQ31484.1 hypothetical protein DTQ70_04485 [Runella sp. SP2]
MSKSIEFLKYLYDSGADTESIDVTKKLKTLGFEKEAKAYDFLSTLEKQKYIQWSDGRPTYTNVSDSIIMSMPMPNAELQFIAKLTLGGLAYVEERKFKVRNTRAVYISITVAVIFGLSTAYLGYSNRDKDNQIEALKAELAKIKPK